MNRSKSILLPLVILALAGCARDTANSNGRLIADYAPDKEPSQGVAPYQATYVLRHLPTPPSDPPARRWVPEQEMVELFVRGLNKYDAVGFEKTADGKLVAIAGKEKIALDPGQYSWHIHPATEYTGMKWFVQETGERTVEIITLPFALAGAAIAITLVGGVFLVTWPFMLL